jgi:hypothetical protein
MKAGQEEMKTMINSIQFKYEETINKLVEGILASDEQQTRTLQEDFNSKIQKT